MHVIDLLTADYVENALLRPEVALGPAPQVLQQIAHHKPETVIMGAASRIRCPEHGRNLMATAKLLCRTTPYARSLLLNVGGVARDFRTANLTNVANVLLRDPCLGDAMLPVGPKDACCCMPLPGFIPFTFEVLQHAAKRLISREGRETSSCAWTLEAVRIRA